MNGRVGRVELVHLLELGQEVEGDEAPQLLAGQDVEAVEHAVVGADVDDRRPIGVVLFELGVGVSEAVSPMRRGVPVRRADDDRRRAVDIAQLPIASVAADKGDQAGVVVLDVVDERRQDRHVGRREFRPDQRVGQVPVLPNGRVDRPGVGAPVVEKLPGVPEDRRILDGQIAAGGRAQVRRRQGIELRRGAGGDGDVGNVIGPQLPLVARVDEGRPDDELGRRAVAGDDRRRGRRPGVFEPVDVDILEVEIGDIRGLERGPVIVGHGVLGGGQDRFPAQVGPEELELVPGQGRDVGDVVALEPLVEFPLPAAVVGEVQGHGQARGVAAAGRPGGGWSPGPE